MCIMPFMNRKPIPLHRGVAKLPTRDLHAIFGTASARAAGSGSDPRPEPANLHERFAESLQREPAPEPSLVDDWRDFVSEVRASPYSHALVALLTVIGWTVLLVAPLLLGWLA